MKPARTKYIFSIILSSIALFSYGGEPRAVPDSVVLQMKNDQAFKYANDPSFWAKEQPADADPAFLRMLANILQSDFLKWILYLFVLAVLGYVVYRIIIQNNLFTTSGKKKKSREEEDELADIAENIDERIQAAVLAKEYRLAVRFYFLKTLRLLEANGKISLHAKTTNYDYVLQMRNYANGADFRKLTAIYEYVWYGEFLPDNIQFEQISAGFRQFNEKI